LPEETKKVPWVRHPLVLVLAVAVLSTAAAVACWRLGWLEGAERLAYDRGLTVFTSGRGRSESLVVVAIDQQSMSAIRANPSYARNFGNYPWDRRLWALVVEELHHQGARAIMFDAVMDERASDPSGDLAFAQVLRETGLPFYLGMAADPAAPALPKVEPVHPPTPAPEPLAAEADALPVEPPSGQEFVELAEEDAYPEVEPLAAARVLAFPVRTARGSLPRIEREMAPGHFMPGRPYPPIGPLLPVVAGFGLVETEPDPDGRMRRTRFAYTDGENPYVTLPVAVAADLFGARELEFTGNRMRLGEHEWTVNADGSAEIDYGGTLEERFRLIPLISVLDTWALRQEGRPGGLPPDTFRDKVVIIGGLAVGLGDVKATPFSAQAPGVSKQAAVLDNLLTGRFITRAPAWVDVSLALGLALLSVALLRRVRWMPLEIGWPVALVFGAFALTGPPLALLHVHVLTVLPALAGVLASVSTVALNHLSANREALFVRRAFSQFMEKALVEQMIESRELPRLDGENLEITAFFSDIRGFSTFSERFREDPRALVRILNTYLTRVSAALLAEGGCLDKYIGDAVVCLFGAPLRQEDHAVRACRGALAVKATVEALREDFRARGLPDVYTRIGVNTAVMFVGNFGSEQLFDYTAIGDGMNLAARLEGANKAYGSLILIGPRTCELARAHIEVRELDRVRVAGKTEAVVVYELLALAGGLSPRQRETVARYHEALALYREARFAEAATVLEARLAEDPEDGPMRALLARCRGYMQDPPPLPFDGVANLEK
jgi:adenylate cyclase